MKWWRRLRGAGAPGRASGSSGAPASQSETQATVRDLREFSTTRRGVEMYVEPRTSVTPTTVVLIAATGEWTRRRVSGPPAAAALAKDLGVPVYDVQLTGYPPRMREWTSRRRASGT